MENEKNFNIKLRSANSSIVGALKFNCQISITNDIKILDKQDIIILPGVGTFQSRHIKKKTD